MNITRARSIASKWSIGVPSGLMTLAKSGLVTTPIIEDVDRLLNGRHYSITSEERQELQDLKQFALDETSIRLEEEKWSLDTVESLKSLAVLSKTLEYETTMVSGILALATVGDGSLESYLMENPQDALDLSSSLRRMLATIQKIKDGNFERKSQDLLKTVSGKSKS